MFVADDIAAAVAADAALAAAQASIAPAQTADAAADAVVVQDLTANGPILIPQADGISFTRYFLAPGAPGYTTDTAKLGSAVASVTPAPPTPPPSS